MDTVRLILRWLPGLLLVYFLGRQAREAVKRGAGKLVAVRLVAGLLFLATGLFMAFEVDWGHAGADGSSYRTAWVLLMMAAMILGVILATSVIGLGLDPDPPVLPYRLIGGVFLGAAVILVLILGSVWAGRHFGIYYQRPLLTGAAVIVIALTLTRPWWYWEHFNARRVRALLTDRGAIAFYLLLAAAALGLAWGGPWVRNVEAGAPDARQVDGALEHCFDLREARTGAVFGRVAYAPGLETGIAFLIPADSTLGLPRSGRWGRDGRDSLRFYFEADHLAARLALSDDTGERRGWYRDGGGTRGVRATEVGCRVVLESHPGR